MANSALLAVIVFLLCMPYLIILWLWFCSAHPKDPGRHSQGGTTMKSIRWVPRYRKGILAVVGFATELVTLGVLHGWSLYLAQAVIAAAAAAGVVIIPNEKKQGAGPTTATQALDQWHQALQDSPKPPGTPPLEAAAAGLVQELLPNALLGGVKIRSVTPVREIPAGELKVGMTLLDPDAYAFGKVTRVWQPEVPHTPEAVHIDIDPGGELCLSRDRIVKVRES